MKFIYVIKIIQNIMHCTIFRKISDAINLSIIKRKYMQVQIMYLAKCLAKS